MSTECGDPTKHNNATLGNGNWEGPGNNFNTLHPQRIVTLWKALNVPGWVVLSRSTTNATIRARPVI
jgi:hypothetical protein